VISLGRPGFIGCEIREAAAAAFDRQEDLAAPIGRQIFLPIEGWRGSPTNSATNESGVP